MEQMDVVKDNKLYCVIRENEEGIPLIKRYSIAWKEFQCFNTAGFLWYVT